jgi:GTP-binding protein EngB required for normal cell division
MTRISLDSTALEQLDKEQKDLLDTIDGLRKHGVGRYVDLPQIIVVGDQSSGKSSVLEAISRVRFPVKDGLCTRFATELILRTDSRTKVDVQIQPASAMSQDVHSFNETHFDKDELPRIIGDAKRIMLSDGAGFSEDVLRVEICGPDVPHLTLVDLPGFYHSEDANQSAAGREIVERLVERYMTKENSIILAIISARNQLILQKVLSKVKLCDKNGERTLGIITKPDTLKPGSQEEENFIRLAKNLDESHRLSLGWHVLRNRGEDEDTSSDQERDQKEEDFFQTSSWHSVPPKSRGINVLRNRLSHVLLDHIENHLEGLVKKIEAKVATRAMRLKQLGESRSTPKELRAYLNGLASQFQITCLNAIDGNYSHEFFGGLFPDSKGISPIDGRIRKLRAFVRDLNRAFAYVLSTKGSTSIIMDKYEDQEDWSPEKAKFPMELPHYLQQLVDLYPFEDPQELTFEQAAAQLEIQASVNQGIEFPGNSNDRLALELFRHQSRPWEAIAQAHVQMILSATQAFIEKLLSYITGPDCKTFNSIITEVINPFFEEKHTVLGDKVEELLRHYRNGRPQPLDSEFRLFLETRRQKRTDNAGLQLLLKTQPDLFTEAAKEKLCKATQATHKVEFDAEGLLVKSEAYYEVREAKDYRN